MKYLARTALAGFYAWLFFVLGTPAGAAPQ
jgi:hypothetical protein